MSYMIRDIDCVCVCVCVIMREREREIVDLKKQTLTEERSEHRQKTDRQRQIDKEEKSMSEERESGCAYKRHESRWRFFYQSKSVGEGGCTIYQYIVLCNMYDVFLSFLFFKYLFLFVNIFFEFYLYYRLQIVRRRIRLCIIKTIIDILNLKTICSYVCEISLKLKLRW